MNNCSLINKYLEKLAKVIDKSLDSNNEKILKKFVENYSFKLENFQKTYAYFLLGNAYNGIRKINHKKNINKIWSLEQEEVFKEIYFLRKAIKQEDFYNIGLELKLGIYVNLANSFSHYGRTINAIKYYDKAIALKFWHKNIVNHPNYFMALINKANALEYYSNLDYDDGHKEYFIKFAYRLYKEALILFEKNKNIYYIDLSIVNKILKRVNFYNKFENIEDIEYFETYEINFSKNENEYRKFCLSNKLFLNSMNDLGNYDISTYDPLNLPNLITKIDEGFPKTITNFNQIKQEFITFRHLLFEGLHEKTPKYYNKEISITDDYDYNLYDINIEKIKIAFRGFYSIFDKIANFIYEYFIKVETQKKIDFRNIWTDKNMKINDVFNKSHNLALRGLYLISKDLFFNNNDEQSKKFIEVLEPEAQTINEIRNHLEHKFISIKLFNSEFLNNEDRKRNFSISRDELEEKTIHLAQLARESLIYLSFSIHIEEQKKDIDKRTTINSQLTRITS
ncbi:LA2681 family HEPN domain-containing protein [Aliarcobacter butzleri]|uniref:LA2681 family HEPN domain-containing protein n=1 Tax=Aliarcobacter butzleri TaxID=28197 RepID=UPI002B249800|nr:LA2681 family HEPN domain-containing protein [Aliarcobacter butzleri]